MKQLRIILLIVSIARVGNAQELVTRANDYFSTRPMEKMLMHLDKPYYAPGDQIWFAAYLLNYQSDVPSAMSEIAYVTLVNQNGQLIHEQRIPLSQGIGEGSILLPDTLSSGFITLHAYTNWMRNFDRSLIYSRSIPVVSFNKPLEVKLPPLQVDFYPEGGQLVENKLANLAYQVNRQEILSGYVTDDKGKIITRTATDENGLGTISLVMLRDYKLHLVNQSDTLVFPIPEASKEGTVLQVQSQPNGDLRISVFGSREYEREAGQIIIQQYGRVVLSLQGEFRKGGFIARAPASQLPSGLLEISLFDAENRKLNERLFYRPHPDKINISTTNQVAPRENIDLRISSSEKATLSVSVIPNKYFEGKKDPLMDAVLPGTTLTEIGTTSRINVQLIKAEVAAYSWDSLMQIGAFTPVHKLEKKNVFTVNGKVDGMQLKDRRTQVITLEEEDGFELYMDDIENQSFSFSLPAFYGNQYVFLKPHLLDEKDERISYRFKPPISHTIDKEILSDFSQAQYDYSRIVKENNVIRQIYQLDYEASQEYNIDDAISFSLLKSPDKTIRLSEYIVLPTMQEVSVEILEGVRIREQSDGSYELVMRKVDPVDGTFEEFSKEQPLMFIDGVAVYDPSLIGSMDPLDIESISMSYGKFELNDVEFHGVISVETVEGRSGLREDYNHGTLDLIGFSYPVRFELPKISEREPDMRTTLYWESGIEVDPDKEISIQFPSSDEPGTYTIHVFGISISGEYLYKSYPLEIRPAD